MFLERWFCVIYLSQSIYLNTPSLGPNSGQLLAAAVVLLGVVLSLEGQQHTTPKHIRVCVTAAAQQDSVRGALRDSLVSLLGSRTCSGRRFGCSPLTPASSEAPQERRSRCCGLSLLWPSETGWNQLEPAVRSREQFLPSLRVQPMLQRPHPVQVPVSWWMWQLLLQTFWALSFILSLWGFFHSFPGALAPGLHLVPSELQEKPLALLPADSAEEQWQTSPGLSCQVSLVYLEHLLNQSDVGIWSHMEVLLMCDTCASWCDYVFLIRWAYLVNRLTVCVHGPEGVCVKVFPQLKPKSKNALFPLKINRRTHKTSTLPLPYLHERFLCPEVWSSAASTKKRKVLWS